MKNGENKERTIVATDLGEVQKKLWDAADELRANSELAASQGLDCSRRPNIV